MGKKKLSRGKGSIVLYQDWFEAILEIPVEKQLQEFVNICNYGFYNIIPESKVDDFGFRTIVLAIDRNLDNYEETCKKNKQNAEKRWAENAEKAITENSKQKTLVCIKDTNDTKGTKNTKNTKGTKNTRNTKNTNDANDAKNTNDAIDAIDAYNDKDNDTDNAKKFENQNEIFANYQVWLNENAPYCANPEKYKQLTINELTYLIRQYSAPQLQAAILVENSKKPRKKYTELYNVLNDWLEKANKSIF